MNQEKIEAKLQAAGVPAQRAEEKAEHSVIGWALTVFGFVAFVVASALVLLIASNKVEVGAFVTILVSVFVCFSFALVVFGMHILAREAAPAAIKAVGDWLVRVIQAIRGNESTS